MKRIVLCSVAAAILITAAGCAPTEGTSPSPSGTPSSSPSTSPSPSAIITPSGDATPSGSAILGDDEKNSDVEVPNPLVNYDTIEEAAAALSFEAKIPSALPEGYELETAAVINEETLSVDYTDGTGSITYRTAEGEEDISGQYSEYAEEKTETVAGMDVTVKGADGKVSLATWTSEGAAYALSFDAALDLADVTGIIESIA